MKIKENVMGLLRKEIYMRMYEIAKEHRGLAKEVDGKDEIREIQESMISILFSYTCLEAYINTIGSELLPKNWTGGISGF